MVVSCCNACGNAGRTCFVASGVAAGGAAAMLVPAVRGTLEAVVPGLRAAHFWGVIGASDRAALKNRRRGAPSGTVGMKATRCWWAGWRGTGVVSDNLNAIRLCLALLVLFSHSFAVLGLPQPQALGVDLGSHAVHAFFAVSGYLIVGSYMRRPGSVQFAVNRTLRIVPALLVAYVFGRVLFEWYSEYSGNPLPFQRNNSLWTIPWEITCYAACVLAGAIGLLHRNRYNVVFAFAWIMALASLGPELEDYALILPMLLSFLTGGFIAVYESDMDMRTAAGISVLVLVGLLLDGWLGLLPRALYLVPDLSRSDIATIQQWPAVVGMAFCVIYLGKYAPPRLVLREDYSYGVYLFAWPTQQVVVATSLSLGLALNPYSLSVAAALPTVCVAALSWHLIEKPALRLKKRGTVGRPLVKQR